MDALAPEAVGVAADRAAGVPIGHALMSHLVAFNLLPSLTLHPEQSTIYPAPAECEPLLGHSTTAGLAHRHWSSHILQTLSLSENAVCDLHARPLVLALLHGEKLTELAHAAGLALLAPRLRRMVARAEVAEASRALGEEMVRELRTRPIFAGSFIPDTSEWDVGQLDAAVPVLGFGLLGRALMCAPSAIKDRALLRLPTMATSAPQLAALEAEAALELALQLLNEREAQWCSLFPSIH
jgi:type III secretion protein K